MGIATLPVQPRRLDRLDHVFVDHDLKDGALWANLVAELRDRRGCRLVWIGERELRAKRMRMRAPQADYWMPFLPDAYFEVTYPNGTVQACVVEIDMGTLTLLRFARKVLAFETALYGEVFRRHLKRDDFEVLILTQSSRRAEALRQVARRVVEIDRHGDYYLSTSTKSWRRRRLAPRPGGIFAERPAKACCTTTSRRMVTLRTAVAGNDGLP
jgi:hypothetical protein